MVYMLLFHTTYSADLANYEIFRAKVGNGGIYVINWKGICICCRLY